MRLGISIRPLSATRTAARHGRRLGDILVSRQLVSRADINAALATQRRTGARLGEILVSTGALSPGALQRSLRVQWRMLFAATLLATAAHVLSALPNTGRIAVMAGETATTGTIDQVVGTVGFVGGEVEVVDATGARHSLTVGSTLRLGDIVETKTGGRADLRLSDGTRFQVNEASSVVLDGFVLQNQSDAFLGTGRHARAALRYLGSKVASVQAAILRTATIGIRG
jgi:hypothetical protein